MLLVPDIIAAAAAVPLCRGQRALLHLLLLLHDRLHRRWRAVRIDPAIFISIIVVIVLLFLLVEMEARPPGDLELP